MNDPSQRPLSLFLRRPFLRATFRSRSEQGLGLLLLLLLSLSMYQIHNLLIQFSWLSLWNRHILPSSWALAEPAYPYCRFLYFTLNALAAWSVWRRFSLKEIAVEFSVFSIQFVWHLAACLCFYVWQKPLFSLFFLLLLWVNLLLTALLFGKREAFAGQLLLFSLLWIFYLVGLNMMICLAPS